MVSEGDVHAMILQHDRCWSELDIEGLASLWSVVDQQASYLGDEYQGPVVGAEALQRHWGRIGSRLRAGRVTSEPVVIENLSDELALVIMDVHWEFSGVEGGPWRRGRSWVSAVLRRTAAGWRFVSYMERLSALD